MEEPYRFIKRARKKNIHVISEHMPDREISAGTDDCVSHHFPETSPVEADAYGDVQAFFTPFPSFLTW